MADFNGKRFLPYTDEYIRKTEYGVFDDKLNRKILQTKTREMSHTIAEKMNEIPKIEDFASTWELAKKIYLEMTGQ